MNERVVHCVKNFKTQKYMQNFYRLLELFWLYILRNTSSRSIDKFSLYWKEFNYPYLSLYIFVQCLINYSFLIHLILFDIQEDILIYFDDLSLKSK